MRDILQFRSKGTSSCLELFHEVISADYMRVLEDILGDLPSTSKRQRLSCQGNRTSLLCDNNTLAQFQNALDSSSLPLVTFDSPLYGKVELDIIRAQSRLISRCEPQQVIAFILQQWQQFGTDDSEDSSVDAVRSKVVWTCGNYHKLLEDYILVRARNDHFLHFVNDDGSFVPLPTAVFAESIAHTLTPGTLKAFTIALNQRWKKIEAKQSDGVELDIRYRTFIREDYEEILLDVSSKNKSVAASPAPFVSSYAVDCDGAGGDILLGRRSLLRSASPSSEKKTLSSSDALLSIKEKTLGITLTASQRHSFTLNNYWKIFADVVKPSVREGAVFQPAYTVDCDGVDSSSQENRRRVLNLPSKG